MFDPLFSSNKISIYSQINITLFELEDCIICSDILGGGKQFLFSLFQNVLYYSSTYIKSNFKSINSHRKYVILKYNCSLLCQKCCMFLKFHFKLLTFSIPLKILLHWYTTFSKLFP